MKEKFGYTNEMQIPKLDKIVVNMGIGEAVADSKKVNAAIKDLAAITGQKPVPTKARTSIAGFKLREGMVIGAKVTLRKDRMYEFLDRLITIALPRVKDFRGLKPTSFDGRGNYALGLQRAHRVPGDQLRRDRSDVGHGHHRLHHRPDRRRSARASEGIPIPVHDELSGGRTKPWPRKAPSIATRWSSVSSSRYAAKRDALKAIANDESLPLEERFEARLKLAKLPRNSSKTRIRNRCQVTGRPRAYLSQAEDVADRAARTGFARARSPAL